MKAPSGMAWKEERQHAVLKLRILPNGWLVMSHDGPLSLYPRFGMLSHGSSTELLLQASDVDGIKAEGRVVVWSCLGSGN